MNSRTKKVLSARIQWVFLAGGGGALDLRRATFWVSKGKAFAAKDNLLEF